MRHNEVRNITADLLTEVCHGVGIEPPNPSQRSNFHSELRTWKMEYTWTLLLKNVWGKDRQCSFFDGVFNPLAQMYQNTSLAQCFRRNKLEKQRAHDERVKEIEHGSFSPLVFSTTGSMGPTASCLQETGLNDRREEQQALQQNPPLDEMSPQIFLPLLCHYVSERQQIISPSSRSSPHTCRLQCHVFGPCLFRRPGPNILLISS